MTDTPAVAAPRRANANVKSPPAKLTRTVIAYAESRLGQATAQLAKIDRSWLTAAVADELHKRVCRIIELATALRSSIESDFPGLKKP